jgi:hypothetical protein
MKNTALEAKLIEAMDNAMCGDYCYDLNCSGCQAARLAAMQLIVQQRVWERWEQVIKPLRVLAKDGLLPKSVVRELAAVTSALKGDAKL